MITQSVPLAIVKTSATPWKQALKTAVTSINELAELLELDKTSLQADDNTAFALRVPLPYVQRMAKGNPTDPLLLQVLPALSESEDAKGFVPHPLQEQNYNPVPGIVHKYHGRVLLITTPVCAIHCRYCFRRHFPYEDNNPGKKQWLDSLHYIRQHSDITEVIFSGGDPLACDDRHLAWLVSELETIPHIKRLRIHTRLPVVIPERVDDDLMAWLSSSRLTTCVVLHVNHQNEIDDQLKCAIGTLKNAGITVLNQSVLLARINDDADTLCGLSETLFAAGALPYYLHTLDPVAGASHFDCSEERTAEIYREMQRRLPGYLLPRLVRDTPGESAKVLIAPQIPG